MTRFAVFNEPPTKTEKLILLRLIDNGDGTVTLHAVDQSGETLCAGRMLIIDSKGFRRVAAVGHDCGLPLDETGHVVIRSV